MQQADPIAGTAVDVAAGTITGIPSGTDVIVSATLFGCTNTQEIPVAAADCPACILPIFTVGTPTCAANDLTYMIDFTSNGDTVTVTDAAGGTIAGAVVGADTITSLPLGTDIIITATTGDCSVAIAAQGITTCPDTCDAELSAGSAICGGVAGTYIVSFVTNLDNVLNVGITGGSNNDDGTATGMIGTDMVITVTDPIDTTCTRVLTISGDVDCPTTCTSPALSIGGTTCAADGGAFYTINFTAAATAGGATAVTVTDAAGNPIAGTAVDVAAGTITGIPSGTDVIVSATLFGCTNTQEIPVAAADCPACILPIFTVGTPTCAADDLTYMIDFTSNGDTVTVTDAAGGTIAGAVVGADSNYKPSIRHRYYHNSNNRRL